METDTLRVAEELRHRLRQQAAVAELGQLALTSRDLDELMREACAHATLGLGAELSSVLEIAPDGKEMLLRAGVGWKEGVVGKARFPVRDDFAPGYRLKTGAPLVIRDLRQDERFVLLPQIREHGIVSGLGVVIYGAKGQYGTMDALSTKPRDFNIEDVNFLQSLANIVGAAIERVAAETRLGESEKKYHALFHNSSYSAALGRLPEGVLVDVNREFERLTGYSRDEAIGSTAEQLGLQPDLELKKQILTEFQKLGALRKKEVPIYTKRGERRLFLVNLDLVEIAGETYSLMTGIDITERKAAEEALAEANLQNRYILSSAGEGIFGIARDGKVSFANPAAARMLGYDTDKLVGVRAHEAFHHSYEDGTPYPVDQCPLMRSVRDGVISRIDDEIYWRRDGTSFPVEYVTTPMPGGDGEIGGAVIVFNDITHRKRTEALVRNIAEGVSGTTGLEFFHSLTRFLAETLNAEYAFVGELVDVCNIRTITVHAPGEGAGNFEFCIDNTPCSDALTAGLCSYPLDVRRKYPGDPLLAQWGIEGYIAAPLRDSAGRTIGLLAVLSRRPYEDVELAESLLRIFAVRAAAELEREHTEEEIRLLQDITLAVGEAPDLMAALEVTLREVCQVTGWPVGEAWVPEEGGRDLVCTNVWHGIDSRLLKDFTMASRQFRFSRGTGLPGRVWASRKPAWIRDVTKDENLPRAGIAEKAGLKTGVGIPVLAGTEVVAVMDFFIKETREEEEHFIELVSGVAAQLGAVLLRKKAEQEVRDGYDRLQLALTGIIEALASTVESRDPYTSGHQKRVARLSEAIAREMGFGDERIRVLKMAASLHDLGKITVPAELLSKPGVITENEFNIIKGHPDAGYRILENVDFPWLIARIARGHHERYDGSGYPDGLKGEEILEESRIMAVADVVEAISAHRPYRPAKGIDAALEEIRGKSGVLYDPEVVAACLRLFKEQGFEMQQEEAA